MGNIQTGFFVFRDAVILDTETDSDAVATAGLTPCGVFVPASFTGTTLSFLVSDAVDGTYVPLHSTVSGSLLSFTVASSRYIAFDPKDFQGVQFLKLKSGSAESGDKTLKLALKGI